MGDDQLNANLRLLKQHRPQLLPAIEPYLQADPPGVLTQRHDGRFNLRCRLPGGALLDVHPAHDPAAAGAEFVALTEEKEGQFIFFLGFGLGYEAKAVCDRCSRLNQIIVIDNDARFFVQAMRYLDLASVITNPKVHLYIGVTLEDLEDIVLRLDRWHLLHAAPYLLVQQNVVQCDPSFFHAAAERLNQLVSAQRLQAQGTMDNARLFLTNMFRNLAAMAQGLPLEQLNDYARGKPAILVCAGPSLKKNLHLLKQQEHRAVIIVVDTAVPQVVAAGVRPHFVVALDHRQRNADYFSGQWEALQHAALIYLSLTTALIPKQFLGDQYFALDEAPTSREIFAPMLAHSQTIPSIFSVSHLGFLAAHRMGCDPIIFIGQDLSFEGEIDPAKVEEKYKIPVPGITKKTVYTTAEMRAAIERFESQMQHLPGTFIDATEGGVRLRHTRVMPLAQAMAAFCTEDIALPPRPRNREVPRTVDRCRTHLDRMQPKLGQIAAECRFINQTAAWAYEHLTGLANRARRDGARQIEMDDDLVRAVNAVRQRHFALAGKDESNPLNVFGHVLDGYLAQTRLAAHREILRWKKRQTDTGAGEGVAGLLGELFSHKIQSAGMLEAADWFKATIATARKRLAYLGQEQALIESSAPAHLVEIGEVFLQSFDLEAARTCFAKAVTENPRNAAAHFGLGCVYLKAHDSLQAMRHFDHAAALDASMAAAIAPLINTCSQTFIEAARDRIRRKRAGARRYLSAILPNFPHYEEASALLASLDNH